MSSDSQAVSGKLLVINQHYPPDTLASGQILAELAEDLVARHGWSVRVIAGPPLKLAQGETWQRVRREERDGVWIRRVCAYNPAQRTLFRRLRHYLSYGIRALLAGLVGPRPDIVMVMSTPPLLTGCIGWVLKVRFRARLVYDVQDLFPDILEKRLQSSAGRLLFLALRWCACFLERRCDGIVVIGRRMENAVFSRAATHAHTIRIPNWSDAKAVVPLGKDSDFARMHNLQECFVIGLSGNLGLNQGIGSILEAAALSANDPWFWLLIGDGENRPVVEDFLRERQLANARWLPYQPKATLAQSLSAFDVGLVTVSAGVSPYLIPSKLYGLMAAEVCILAAVDDDSEVAAFVREEEIGMVVPPEDPLALVRAVRFLYTNPAHVQQMGERGRQVLLDGYDRHHCTSQYNVFLRELIQP